MKSLLLIAALLAVLSTTGCRTRYEITLGNQNKITAFNKPRLVNGFWVFKDAAGQEVQIFQARVRQIEAK